MARRQGIGIIGVAGGPVEGGLGVSASIGGVREGLEWMTVYEGAE